ncbi:MAG: hypothetical protein AB7I35_14120 [Ramlibacter sp.]
MDLNCFENHLPGDHPRLVAVREHLARLCGDFWQSRLADSKFEAELCGGLEQKFWSCVSEALVYARLAGKKFGERQRVGEGPDFLVLDGSRLVWIEVVCPEPVDVPQQWLNPQEGVIHFPHEQILLRWTSAIAAKAGRLLGESGGRRSYLDAGIVGPNDAYVIAVNGCRLRSGAFPALMGISQFPFAAEAVFPIGPYQLELDRDTFEVVSSGHQHRPSLLNRNSAEVSVLTFLEPRFRPISAIWAVDFNGGAAIGNSEPAVVVHNPHALNRVPLGFLSADDEYEAVADGAELVLTRIDGR